MHYARVRQTIDCQAGGKPLRITPGSAADPGSNCRSRRRSMMEHLDHVRRRLM
jgi:proline racemase